MRYNFLMPYISKQELAFSNNAFQHSYTSLSAVTTKYSRDSAINNCQSWGGGTELCSCVTSLAYNKSIPNFKIEVQNSTCTGDRLNYGHIMQTLPHSLCSFHHPHGTVENKTQNQRLYTADIDMSKISLFLL